MIVVVVCCRARGDIIDCKFFIAGQTGKLGIRRRINLFNMDDFLKERRHAVVRTAAVACFGRLAYRWLLYQAYRLRHCVGPCE